MEETYSVCLVERREDYPINSHFIYHNSEYVEVVHREPAKKPMGRPKKVLV
jgi:hypothetical protein